jgi:hypothetical protein
MIADDRPWPKMRGDFPPSRDPVSSIESVM